MLLCAGGINDVKLLPSVCLVFLSLKQRISCIVAEKTVDKYSKRLIDSSITLTSFIPQKNKCHDDSLSRVVRLTFVPFEG